MVSGNQITGPLTSPVEPSLYGIVLANTTGDSIFIVNNEVEEWDQGGIYCYDETEAKLDTNTILDNEYYGILCLDQSTPYVRWCTINGHNIGVHCEGNSFPDLGTGNDSGYNSILMDNSYWVVNANDVGGYVMAEYNWWGTEKPDGNSEKFAGLVDYNPWLTEAPEGEGEGGQSANIIKPIPLFALYAPKPNPAKREIRIAYSLSNQCKSELIICNISGRIVTKIIEEKDIGNYEYLWDGKDQKGKVVPNGIYFVRLKAGDNLQTQKITLAR